MLPRISDRLVARNVVLALLLVWATLLAFDLIGGFIDELDEIGEGNYDALTAFFYIAYSLPRRAYTLFPTAAMIGCLLGMGALAASSELTALRSAGLSRLRICLAAVAVVFVLTIGMVVVGETIGPLGDQRAQALEVSAKSDDVAVTRGSGVWAREGDTFLNARHGRSIGIGAEATIELDDVRLYEFDGEGRLLSIAVAKRAEHGGGAWTLFDVRRSVFGENAVTSAVTAQEHWDSALNPDVLSLGVTRPRYLSTADLTESLSYLERNGLDVGAFENAYWARWFYPVNALVLCLSVLPFAFGTLRSGGFGKRLFLGIVFGLGYFVMQTLTVNMAEVFRFDLRIANALPPLAVALGCWAYFRNRM